MTGPNPLAMLAQSLGAGSAAGPGGMATGGPNLGSMASELQGADPAFLLKALNQLKQHLSDLFSQSTMRLPNVAGNIAKTMTTLDRAIKEAQQAATTQSVVRGPIGFTMAGQTGEGGPSGQPSIGGF